MSRRLLVILLISALVWSISSARAATTSLAYGGLSDCYILGEALPSFTLTAQVSDAGNYRITHAVALNNSAGVPVTVYNGPIDPATPQTVTLAGGNATVVGTYTLRAELYDSAATRVAETSAMIEVAPDCTEPTPAPSPIPSTQPTPQPAPSPDARPDIQWSQRATPSRGVAVDEIVMIAVRGTNAGNAGGSSSALFRYDPALLRLLDAQPGRTGDWVRDRDDAAGTLTLTFGRIESRESATLLLRFRALRPNAETLLRLVRDDGQDQANPLFLSLGTTIDGPLPLEVIETDTPLVLRGRGYKPGESIAVWGNTREGRAVPLAAVASAAENEAGTVELQLSSLDNSITSVVVVGRLSGVTSVVDLVDMLPDKMAATSTVEDWSHLDAELLSRN